MVGCGTWPTALEDTGGKREEKPKKRPACISHRKRDENLLRQEDLLFAAVTRHKKILKKKSDQEKKVADVSEVVFFSFHSHLGADFISNSRASSTVMRNDLKRRKIWPNHLDDHCFPSLLSLAGISRLLSFLSPLLS